MITLQRQSSHLIAVLTAVALAGCVKSDQANQSADSTAWNLTLAPTESTAAIKDVPAPATQPAKVAPEKKASQAALKPPAPKPAAPTTLDRKSTRLNSSHLVISYAVFCLKKKKKKQT